MKNNVISLDKIREEKLETKKEKELRATFKRLAQLLIIESDTRQSLDAIFERLENEPAWKDQSDVGS